MVYALACLHEAHAGDKLELGPEPAWVQQTQLPPEQSSSDDAAYKILLLDTQLNFTTTGTEAYYHTLTRLQTPQGLAAGAVVLPWNPATDVLTVHKVHIIRGSQVIDVLGTGQTFTVLRREKSLEYATLNGLLTAVMQPEGLQVGDMIDVAFSFKRSDPVVGTAEWVLAGWPDIPISHMRIRGRWAGTTAIRWKASEAMTGVREVHHDGATEVIAALDDVAPLTAPKGAPARYRVGRELEFSGFKAWAQIAQRLAPLYAKAAILTPQSPLRAEVALIKASGSDPGVQAMAALRLVQDKVRYVLLGMNEGGLVPADADLTWERRFGDCKGKTALLLALLHALDIDAVPVAVNTRNGDSVRTALPMVAAFDHVLVRAVIHGKEYWLDGTGGGDRRLDTLTVPPYYSGLPLIAKGDLVQIVPTPLAQPGEEMALHIDASGGIPGTAPFHGEVVLRGAYAALVRLGFGNLAPADRDQALRKIWSATLASAKVDSVSAHFDEQTAEEHITADGSVPLEWTQGRLQIRGLELAYGTDFTRESDASSGAPFAVPFPIYRHSVETIKLPQADSPFTLEGGDDLQRTIDGAEIHRQVRIDNGVLTGETSLRTIVPEISSAQARDEQHDLRDVSESTIYLRAPAGYLASADRGHFEIQGPKLAGALLGGSRLTTDDLFDTARVNLFIDDGNAAMNRHDLNQAIDDFGEALLLNPMAAMALADRGMAYAWKGETTRAAQDLDAAAKIDSHNAVVPRARGLLALSAGKFSEAVADFTTSLELQPHNIFALSRRAQAYSLSGESEKALADAAEVIRLEPAYVDGYVFRANLLRQRGRSEEALKDAAAVVAASPSNPAAWIAAAGIYREAGDNARAMTSLDRSIEIAPSVSTYLTRYVYRDPTDVTGRKADVDAALALDPKSVAALVQLAAIQRDTKDYAGAIATVNKAISIHDDPRLWVYRGINYALSGQAELARQDFAAARPKLTAASDLNNMCWAMATAGAAYDTALSWCDAAVAAGHNYSNFLDSRGFVLLRMGRYSEAIASYDAALKQNGTSIPSLYGRGIAKRRKGETQSGDADLKAATDMDAHVPVEFAGFGVKP